MNLHQGLQDSLNTRESNVDITNSMVLKTFYT